jgi:ABC-2 type transport system permease protein
MAAIQDKINVGMMIFFMFYGAATTALSILREDEERTLWRLFTTPPPRETVLAGKFLSVFVVTLAQTLVLILASRLLFAARWGMQWGAVLLVLTGCMAAAGVGLFLMSLLRSTRQAGIVLGGVLTVLGMAGGIFTAGFQNLPKAFDTVRLFTPHGWAMRGWEALIRGDGIGATLMPAAACAAFGIVFFAIGARIFRRRYA